MTLVVEDGSIVTDADSYVSVADARTYAAKRKKPLPVDDGECEALLIEAMDYLEAKRSDFQGWKHMFTQALQWPRHGVCIDGQEFPDDEIPAVLVQAQIRLAMEANAGTELMPTRTGPMVTREKVDVIETQYSETVGTGIAPEISAVDALLKPLLRDNVGIALKTYRA